MRMPHRLLPRKMTSPTARVLASIWLAVFSVSGYTMFINYREASCDQEFRQALMDRAEATENQREAVAKWIQDFSHPPPGADHYGPERLVWLQGVSNRALALFYVEKPPPLPDIKCGR